MDIDLIRRQKPMIKAFSNIFIDATFPSRKKINLNPIESKNIEFNIDPVISAAFHDLFKIRKRTNKTIAPHMFPQWVFPELFKLLRATNLPLHKIINRGFKLSVHEKISQNTQYYLNCSLNEIVEKENKYYINQKILVTDKFKNKTIEAEIFSIILKSPKGKSKRPKEVVESLRNFNVIKTKFITKHFAKRYAQVSGDFNPIHLNSIMARIFGFKSSIMHGFGLMSLFYEFLENQEIEFNQMEMKFIKPVLLNSEVQFEVENSNNDNLPRNIRIKSSGGEVNVIGSINKTITIS